MPTQTSKARASGRARRNTGADSAAVTLNAAESPPPADAAPASVPARKTRPAAKKTPAAGDIETSATAKPAGKAAAKAATKTGSAPKPAAPKKASAKTAASPATRDAAKDSAGRSAGAKTAKAAAAAASAVPGETTAQPRPARAKRGADAAAPPAGKSKRAPTSKPAPARTARHERDEQAPPQAPVAAEPAAVEPAGPSATVTALDDSLFGRYAVDVPGEAEAEVTLRTAHAGTACCSCLDHELIEDGRCAHIQALEQWLQADAGRAQALAAGPQRVGSRVQMLQGARRRLLWLPGTECPPALDTLADEVLGVPADELSDQAVPRLLRAAREAGHGLQVDESVWQHLAVSRDTRWRVHRLQSLLPDGPASAELAALLPAPLLPLQWEGALFAVCAGRSMLADCAELQPWQQALAAARLAQRHFGVQRVLVLAEAEALGRWRQALPDDAQGFSLMALDHVADDAERHRALAPDWIIVDEPAVGGLWVDAERAAALLRLPVAQAVVLPAPGWRDRPAELPLRLAFVDAPRVGPYAALLQTHGERDADGQLCGLHDLDDIDTTLAPVLLARRFEQVQAHLPERVDHTRRVALDLDARAAHGALLDAVAAAVDGWQSAGWLADAAQRRLLAQVQALRALCAGQDQPAVADAKAGAVQAVLAESAAPLVVFSQWPQALAALQSRLAAVGVESALWSADQPAAARQAAAQRFEQGQVKLLCVADPGSTALELRCPTARVLHLDLPWHPRGLARRFGRVHRRGKAHLVPVTQLLLDHSFEHALAQLQAGFDGPAVELLDANAAEGFVQGEALAAWRTQLQQVLALAAPKEAAAA